VLVWFLLLSGATALVFQGLWMRQLGLVAGIEVEATSVVVSGFFLGLAIGSRVFGARADRSDEPWRLYAGLELGSGVLGVLATFVLSESAVWFVPLRALAGQVAWVPLLLLVAAPSALMGGTLPVLLRVERPTDARVGRRAGLFYAANTAGAIAGVLLTPFALLPWLGVRGSAFAAGAANALLAIVAWRLLRGRGPNEQHRQAEAVSSKVSRDAQVCLTLYGAAGGVALGYEILWTQTLVQFLSTRAYAFAVVLATYLSGLALGSYAYARVADRVQQRWAVFGLLVAGAGVSALGGLALLDSWLPALQGAFGRAALDLTGSRMLMMCARFAVAAGSLVLLPTLLLGAAYPAAMRVAASASRVGADAGRVVAVNTAGGITGSLLTGFALLPALGLMRSFATLALLSVAIGATATLYKPSARRLRALAGALALASIAGFVWLPRDKLARLLADERGGETVFYEEAASGSVAVLEQTAPGGAFRRLYIQGVSNTGDAMPSLRYMRLQAFVPLVAAKAPRSALVIGLGTGITCGALGAWPGLERRACVELSPAVVRAARHFQGNFDVTRDPRFQISVADGRHQLLAANARYDVITLEPPPPAAAGVVNLYSREFYALARNRLAEGGVLAQWWPLATQNDADSRSLVQSFLQEFPHVALFSTELHEMLLLGGADPLEFDLAEVEARLEAPTTQRALAEVGIASPAALLGTYVTGRQGLEAYAQGAAPVTDDDPRIEYSAWVRPGELARVLPHLLELASDPPIADRERSPAALAAIEAERQSLHTFYRGALAAMLGDRDGWASAMQEVAPMAPRNAYYAWFLGSQAQTGVMTTE